MNTWIRTSVPVLLLTLVCGQTLHAQIQKSVGQAGVNLKDDVRRVQVHLNAISDLSGGPKERLAEDGLCGPHTIAAIQRFQSMQLGLDDGRIDPGGKTEIRLRRLAGQHVLLGEADSEAEKELAEFASTFTNITVTIDGRLVSVRPPYHINIGKRKEAAIAMRQANPRVDALIRKTVGAGGPVGKATPQEMRAFLQAAVDAGLVTKTPNGLRDFLARYGISTDCSGLAARACNLLRPENPLDVVNKANTAYLAKLSRVPSPVKLTPGSLMVKGGSHVRLITDVDHTPEGIEFTTLESTASRLFPNGNGVGERRWRFGDQAKFDSLQEKKASVFVAATAADKAYIYTKK